MHFFAPAILALVTSVHAIDVYFHTSFDCGGDDDALLGCLELPPQTCCSFENPASPLFNSIIYTNIPLSDRTTVASIYDGPGCTAGTFFPEAYPIDDVEEYCIKAFDPATGTKYDLWGSKKRNIQDEACLSKREPDTLILRDGSSYNILGLEKKELHQMLSLVKKGATAADVPDSLKSLKLKV